MMPLSATREHVSVSDEDVKWVTFCPAHVEICLAGKRKGQWKRCDSHRQSKGRRGLQVVLHEIGVTSR